MPGIIFFFDDKEAAEWSGRFIQEFLDCSGVPFCLLDQVPNTLQIFMKSQAVSLFFLDVMENISRHACLSKLHRKRADITCFSMVIPDVCRVIHLFTPSQHMGRDRTIRRIGPGDERTTGMDESEHQGWGEVIPVGNDNSSRNLA